MNAAVLQAAFVLQIHPRQSGTKQRFGVNLSLLPLLNCGEGWA